MGGVARIGQDHRRLFFLRVAHEGLSCVDRFPWPGSLGLSGPVPNHRGDASSSRERSRHVQALPSAELPIGSPQRPIAAGGALPYITVACSANHLKRGRCSPSAWGRPAMRYNPSPGRPASGGTNCRYLGTHPKSSRSKFNHWPRRPKSGGDRDRRFHRQMQPGPVGRHQRQYAGHRSRLGHGGLRASGAAYVFTKSGNSWIKVAELTASDSNLIPGHFGYSVAISGNTVVVGSPWTRVGQNALQGAAYCVHGTGLRLDKYDPNRQAHCVRW